MKRITTDAFDFQEVLSYKVNTFHFTDREIKSNEANIEGSN